MSMHLKKKQHYKEKKISATSTKVCLYLFYLFSLNLNNTNAQWEKGPNKLPKHSIVIHQRL